MAAKSAGYTCYGLSDNIGLFLLCEVALGNEKEYHNFHHDADTLPSGCHSTHGIGQTIPDPA